MIPSAVQPDPMELIMLAAPTPTDCPCGSPRSYADCCQPLHNGLPAPSAGRLMRSRYSAYTLGLIDYLVATTWPAQQRELDVQAMAEWSNNSRWLGLRVEHESDTGNNADRAQVTFTARWADADSSSHEQRECSSFVRLNQRWYFITPECPVSAGRNDPCPCGSGRKFKQCCRY